MAGESENPNKVYEDLISNEEWHQIIAKKLGTTDFKLEGTKIGPLSEDQLGFMGDHLKLEVVVYLPKSAKKETLLLFAKSVPMKNKAFRDYVDAIRGFDKEIGFFADLLPDLQRYVVKSKEVTENKSGSSPQNWTCECYLAKPEILVLENLFAVNFKHTADREPLDYNHCILMLQTMANFHASSIIFEEKQPKKSQDGKSFQIFDKHKDILFETEWVMTEGHPGNKFMRASIKGMVSLLEYIPKYGRNYENFGAVREKLPKVLEQMCENVKPSTKFRNVICHGDLWASNVFFRYDKNNKPIEARIVDFQLIRYNPPASEIMWFLYLVTRREFREAHMDEFLTVYYQSLTAELKRNNLDISQLLPWSEFKESCDFYQNAGRLAVAMYFQQCMMAGEYLKGVFSDPHHMTMFQITDKSEYLIECYKNDPMFRERNTEVIEEMIEHCVLNK